jgi:hypothetical protein
VADQQQQQSPTLPASAAPTVAGLVAAQQATNALVRQRVLQAVRAIWQRLPDYRNPDQFVAQVVPIVQAGQQQTAATTAAYLSHLYAQLTGDPVRMLGVPSDVATGGRDGVTPAEVYARPLHEVWRQLHDLPHVPGAVEQAIAAGLTRAENLAATDLQLAKTHAAQHVLAQQTNVTGYRRVLEGTYSCGLCIVAATRRYHKAELLPIHPGCDCSVEPIIGHSERVMAAMVRTADGQLTPVADLADVHERIADTFGKDSTAARAVAVGSKDEPINYRDIIVIHDHSELGPVLGVRGQEFKHLPELGKNKPISEQIDVPTAGGAGGEPPQPPKPPVPTAGGDPFDAIPPPGPEITRPDLSKLTQDEQLALARYTSITYTAVNKALRASQEATAATPTRNAIAHIDSALAKYPLPGAVRVSRGVGIDAFQRFGVQSHDGLRGIVGKTIGEPAYMSTSFNRTPPSEFLQPGNVILDLIVPAGTPALALEALSDSPGERELLVARGQRLYIVSAVYDEAAGRWTVQAYLRRGE